MVFVPPLAIVARMIVIPPFTVTVFRPMAALMAAVAVFAILGIDTK